MFHDHKINCNLNDFKENQGKDFSCPGESLKHFAQQVAAKCCQVRVQLKRRRTSSRRKRKRTFMFVVFVHPEDHGDFYRRSTGRNLRCGGSNRRVAGFENGSVIHTCQCFERFRERTAFQSYFLSVKLESQVGCFA